MSRLLKEFWASGHFFVLFFVFVNVSVCFLGFWVWILFYAVKRMLKCVYMILLVIPISGFAVMLMKKLLVSLLVCDFFALLLLFWLSGFNVARQCFLSSLLVILQFVLLIYYFKLESLVMRCVSLYPTIYWIWFFLFNWDFTIRLNFDFYIHLFAVGLPGVLTVRPDPDYNSVKKNYSCSDIQMSNPRSSQIGTTLLFPLGATKHWLVRMDKPGVGVVTKAQMVDRYAQILTKVLGK